jgi:hypothetical protein
VKKLFPNGSLAGEIFPEVKRCQIRYVDDVGENWMQYRNVFIAIIQFNWPVYNARSQPKSDSTINACTMRCGEIFSPYMSKLLWISVIAVG